MDQQPEQLALVIAECPDAQLFRLINNSRSKLAQGAIKLAQLQDIKTYFLNVDRFCQNIVPGTPFVMITREKGSTLLFPHVDQGLNGIFIPKLPEQEYFLTQLNNVVQLVAFEEAIQIEQFKDTINLHCANIQSNPLEENNDVANYIHKAGDMLKTGFTWFGGVVASGINKGGEYIQQKINQQEEVKVSDDTKSKYNSVKEKAGQAFAVSANILKQLYTPVANKTKEVTSEISQKIDSSDNKLLHQGKQLTVATWDAAGTAISGLGAALSQIGSSIGNNTKTIVEKKYGTEVTETFIGGQQPRQENQVQYVQLQETEPLMQERKNPYPDLSDKKDPEL